MVCWAEPNPNVKPRTEEECDCLAAIREMESDKDLMDKVSNVEKAIKKNVKGVTACAEGALYSVPSLQVRRFASYHIMKSTTKFSIIIKLSKCLHQN